MLSSSTTTKLFSRQTNRKEKKRKKEKNEKINETRFSNICSASDQYKIYFNFTTILHVSLVRFMNIHFDRIFPHSPNCTLQCAKMYLSEYNLFSMEIKWIHPSKSGKSKWERWRKSVKMECRKWKKFEIRLLSPNKSNQTRFYAKL